MTAYTLEKQNVLQRRAWSVVAAAIRTGELIAPDCCQRCGKKAKLEAHHEDYRHPLAVQWLCPSCHAAIHGKLRKHAWKSIGGKYARRSRV